MTDQLAFALPPSPAEIAPRLHSDRTAERARANRTCSFGCTFSPILDGHRLSTQQERVFALMVDGRWRTLAEIAGIVRGSEAGVSARLRDFRKRAIGPDDPHALYRGHKVLRRRRGLPSDGVHEYRLVIK